MPFLVESPPFFLEMCTEKQIKNLMDKFSILQPNFAKKWKVTTKYQKDLDKIMAAAKREKEKADEVPKLVRNEVVVEESGQEVYKEVFSKFKCLY